MQIMQGWAAATVVALLTACGGGGGGGSSSTSTCTETGVSASYACQTGSTEPLYRYQWALKLAGSYFSAFSTTLGGSDLNVEDAHQSGVKGQGVRVLVLDDGLEVTHEDLVANVDLDMSHNFSNGNNNPTPTGSSDAHGTSVSGIIAAAQNGKGVMGIAPRATLGGANFLKSSFSDQVYTDAYGGVSWSSNADIINASYGSNTPNATPSFSTVTTTAGQTAIRAFPNLRGGKGLIYLKASGNEFFDYTDGGGTTYGCPAGVSSYTPCENPAHDVETLEPNVLVVTAANAKAQSASYANVGSVNWVTGMGGEYANAGIYGGESGGGPTLYTTDQLSCSKGFSTSAATANNFLKGITTLSGVAQNANCDYGMLNGTSAATPAVAGVVALMLQANPNLTWRDVREILRASSRKIQASYGTAFKLLNLSNGTFTATAVGGAGDLSDGSTTARVEYGWQTNAAGYPYANAFGFGLVDAAAAVNMAKATTSYRSATLSQPSFASAFADVTSLGYGRVTKIGTFTVAGAGQVDALQLSLSGSLCIGSVGVYVKSPSGTVSTLSVPYNIYYNTGKSALSNYTLSSYAFFGESKAGNWEVYLVSGTPGSTGAANCSASPSVGSPLVTKYRIFDRV